MEPQDQEDLIAALKGDAGIKHSADACRRNFKTFFREAWGQVEPAKEFVPGWHIDAVCEHLHAVAAGEIRNLCINIPPRSTKSTIASVCFMAWVWTFRPASRWLTASYALPLAIRDNVRCRRLMESPWYRSRFGDVFKLAADQNVKVRYENSRTGHRIATSVGSGVTGEGGDFLMVDDPHNAQDVESEATRDAAVLWWDQAFYGRANDAKRSARIVIGQRTHVKDLFAHIQGKGGFEWLVIPEEHETVSRSKTWIFNDPPCGGEQPKYVTVTEDPRTEPGELLRPERFGPEQIKETKNALGAVGYAGQHQQRPVPLGGTKFQASWFRYYTRRGDYYILAQPGGAPAEAKVVLPQECRRYVFCDTAGSAKSGSSYTVFLCVDVTPHSDIVLVDLFRERMEVPDIFPALQTFHAKHRPLKTMIEAFGPSGKGVIQTARRKGMIVVEVMPDGATKDSHVRAGAAMDRIKAGQIYIPQNAHWREPFEQELLYFPHGETDDCVDVCAYAARFVDVESANEVAAFLPFNQDSLG